MSKDNALKELEAMQAAYRMEFGVDMPDSGVRAVTWSLAWEASSANARAEHSDPVLTEVVAEHIKDLRRCVPIFNEHGMEDTAIEFEKAATELGDALSVAQIRKNWFKVPAAPTSEMQVVFEAIESGAYTSYEAMWQDLLKAAAPRREPSNVSPCGKLIKEELDKGNAINSPKALPNLPEELYEFYPAMSAQNHEAAVKEYTVKAIRALLLQRGKQGGGDHE